MSKMLTLFMILTCIFGGIFFSPKKQACHMLIDGTMWQIELARTSQEHVKGLMNRDFLCQNCGMLFVSDVMEEQDFWMKNTHIPLDMYFYDDHGVMMDLALNMRPEGETIQPMTYQSRPSRYVLEVNAGSDENFGFLPLQMCL